MPTTLLLADDSVTIQKVVSLTFADEDVVLEAVGSGDLALEKAKLLRPDVVLADIFMPGPNGYEVCERIKADPELADVPVVLLVGTFEPFDEVEATRVRCDAYLTKPFDTSELVETVHALVRRRRSAPAPAPVDEAAATHPPAAALASESALHAATAVEAVAAPEPAPVEAARPPAPALVSPRTRDSFLGAGRILDLFEVLPPPRSAPVVPETGGTDGAAPADVPAPSAVVCAASEAILSDAAIDAIVERVVERMSPDVVRAAVREIVPELAEDLIRQYLEEHPPGRRN
jgi:CheY-like chemotaxis protein